MRILRVVAFLFAVSIVTASIAKADTLSGIWQVDDGYTAYLSTSPTSIAGATVLDTEECWDCTYTISANLTPGTTYYLMVDANNNFGNIGGILGQFSLTGDFVFENGTQSLLTNTTDWTYSYAADGWGTDNLTPGNYGPNVSGENGAGPGNGWGANPNISANAEWIWDQNSVMYEDGDLYFETTIIPTTSPVPEPGTLLLLGSGLLTAAGMLRRRFAK